MIHVTYKSSFKTNNVKRYVKKSGALYRWCLQDQDSKYDIQQGTCDLLDLPEDVRKACDEYNGSFYACEWKL